MVRQREPAPEKPPRPAAQLDLSEAPGPPADAPRRPPIVLDLSPGPRPFAVAVWVRDEGETAVYRIVQRDIRAAKVAATLARQLEW